MRKSIGSSYVSLGFCPIDRGTTAHRLEPTWHANAALTDIPDKQESHGIQCVLKTLAAFQSGPLNRWSAAKFAANIATQIARGCRRIHLCQKTPFGRKTLFIFTNNVTRLDPTTLTTPSLKKKERLPSSLPKGSNFAKPQFSESTSRDRFSQFARCNSPG